LSGICPALQKFSLHIRIGPGFLFGGSLDNFNWITWIKPQSKTLALITGGSNGLGLNPWPTWDWNRAAQFIDVCTLPQFTKEFSR
jgi:OPT oligopeptide transporter protein